MGTSKQLRKEVLTAMATLSMNSLVFSGKIIDAWRATTFEKYDTLFIKLEGNTIIRVFDPHGKVGLPE